MKLFFADIILIIWDNISIFLTKSHFRGEGNVSSVVSDWTST
jgi:hypothetical protein